MKYLILVAFFLSGCSQTTVHLYSRYLSDTQIKEINKELVEADFIVKVNQLTLPASITLSSLTYSPLINDRNAVNKVINAMNNIAWDIHHTSMLFTDNHWYKENSIALMLVPPGVDLQSQTNQQDWVNMYKSQNCDRDLSIHLKRDGHYKILNDKNLLIKHDYVKGKWSISDFPYLELRAKDSDWGFFFELKTYTQKDKIGEVHIWELAPMNNYPVFAGCSFVYGIRL